MFCLFTSCKKNRISISIPTRSWYILRTLNIGPSGLKLHAYVLVEISNFLSIQHLILVVFANLSLVVKIKSPIRTNAFFCAIRRIFSIFKRARTECYLAVDMKFHLKFATHFYMILPSDLYNQQKKILKRSFTLSSLL